MEKGYLIRKISLGFVLFLCVITVSFQNQVSIHNQIETGAIRVDFTHTTHDNLIKCTGTFNSGMTQYMWQVSSIDNYEIGTTGWQTYNTDEPLIHWVALPDSSSVVVTFWGSDGMSTHSHSETIEISYAEPPDDMTVLEIKKTYPDAGVLSLTGYGYWNLDIGLFAVVCVALVVLYFGYKRWKK